MQIETLGDAWTHSATVWMRCAWGKRDGLKSIRECTYSSYLDMETLICTRGRNFPIGLLSSRLKCPRCGSMRVRVVWEFPSRAHEGRAVVG